MKKGLICVVLVFLSLLAFGWMQAYRAITWKPASPHINEDAIVYILRIALQNESQSGLQYKGLSIGFAVGDGRYIVTAAHCVREFETTRGMLYYPSVISPYYGDIVAAKLVAIDHENDIAILEANWDVHPALQLEPSDAWKTASRLVMATYPPPSEEHGGNGSISHALLTETTRKVTLVDTAGVKKQKVISASPIRYPGPGWSGSPFIVPETGNVAGLMAIVGTEKGRFNSTVRYSSGPDVDAIRQLFEANSLCYQSTGLSVPEMSRKEEFKQILSFFDVFTKDQTQMPDRVKQVCADFPDTFAFYMIAGFFLNEPNLPTDYFQRLTNMAPEDPFAHAASGILRWAMKDNLPQAAADFKRAAELDTENLFAHNVHLQMLVMTDPNAAEILAQDLIARWPQEAQFWFEYARLLRNQNRLSEELPMIQKAVELAPADNIPYQYQRHLADSLAANGRLDAAEQAYATLLEVHTCANCRNAYATLLEKIGTPEQAEEVRLGTAPQPCSP